MESYSFVRHVPTVCSKQVRLATLQLPTQVDEVMYLCDLCDNKNFKTSDNLMKHINKFHNSRQNNKFDNAKQSCIIETENLPQELKVCDVCKDKFFCSLYDLNNHMLQAHVKTQTIICIDCDNSSFASELELKQHQLCAHRRWSKLGNETYICNEDC